LAQTLRQVLVDGRIKLTPQPDGSWLAESMLIVGRLAGRTRKPRKGSGLPGLRDPRL
jgi:hypothetical protein